MCKFFLQDVLLPGSRVITVTLCGMNEQRKCKTLWKIDIIYYIWYHIMTPEVLY